jgi:hypothetical protein
LSPVKPSAPIGNFVLEKPGFGNFGPDEVECTFKPKINAISRSMATYVKPLNTEEGINYYIEQKKLNLKLLKSKYVQDEVVDYGFHPIINEKSKELAKMRYLETEITTRLMKEGERLGAKKLKYVEEYMKIHCPFPPK